MPFTFFITLEESSAALEGTLRKLGLVENFEITSMIPEDKTPVEFYTPIKKLIGKEGFNVLVLDKHRRGQGGCTTPSSPSSVSSQLRVMLQKLADKKRSRDKTQDRESVIKVIKLLGE